MTLCVKGRVNRKKLIGSWYEYRQPCKRRNRCAGKPCSWVLIDEAIKGLFLFAKDFGYQEKPEGYLSKCDFCLDIREYLVSKGDFKESILFDAMSVNGSCTRYCGTSVSFRMPLLRHTWQGYQFDIKRFMRSEIAESATFALRIENVDITGFDDL